MIGTDPGGRGDLLDPGLVLDPTAAEAVAATLAATAASLRTTVGTALPLTTPAALSSWRGDAAAGYAEQLRRAVALADWAVPALTAGAAAIREYASLVAVARVRLQQVAVAIAEAERAAATGSLAEAPARWAEADRWRRTRAVVLDDVADAGERLAVVLLALLDPLTQRPRRFAEQLVDFSDGLADQAAATGFLLTGWSWDRDRWGTATAGIPAGVVDDVRHPVATVEDDLAVEDFARGSYGSGLAVVVGFGLLRGPLDRLTPEVPGQSLGELELRVDLDRHESPLLGHTLERHVGRDDAFLRARLVPAEGSGLTVARAPRSASTYVDRAVAEDAITRTIRANIAELRTMLADPDLGKIVLSEPLSADAGRSFRLDGQELRAVEVGRSVVVLRRADTGWYLLTCYPDQAVTAAR